MVTPIRTADQADYRLCLECGSDEVRAADVAVDYRLAVDEAEADAIVRLGSGWAEFDQQAGTPLESEADVEAVRQIMAGRDPRTGQRLIRFKTAVAPEAKLAARPLVEAVQALASEREMTPAALLCESGWSAKRFARLQKGLVRDGEYHSGGVQDLSRVATAAGIGLEEVYERGELGRALAHADERVDIGTRGYDVTFDRPRKLGIIEGLAPPAMARRMEQIHDEAVAETMRHVEGWVGYAMVGHHGDGQAAERAGTTGLIATATKHRTARPVGDGPGDPHTHTHVMVSVMGRSTEDGQWRTVGAGGRELMRHVSVMGELQRALERRALAEEFGLTFARDEVTGRWDVVGVPDHVKHGFSRRQAQIKEAVGEGAVPAVSRAAARRTAQAKTASTRAQERASWAERVAAMGHTPRALVQAALEGRDPGDGNGPGRGPEPGPPDLGPPDISALAAAVWDPETGVTSKDKITTRAKIMAAVAEACPNGLASGEELVELTDKVLEHEAAVPLPARGASHMAHSDRYTSADIVAAEEAITASVQRRRRRTTLPLTASMRSLRAWERAKGLKLSDEQRSVVMRQVLMARGVDTVVGVAGSGKTTIMSATRSIWDSLGYRVEGAANSAVAAAGLRTEAGIDSGTVASLLRRIEDGPGLSRVGVLVLDEAATIDDRSLAAIVTEAERTGTRILAIGDPQQARAVGAGGAFARVHEIVDGPVLTENRRQKGPVDRKALQTWRDGARRSALALWGERGMIHAPPDADAARARIAEAWARDRRGYTDPHEAVAGIAVMAATRADVRDLNTRIRTAAREAGHLTGQPVNYLIRGGHEMEVAAGDQVHIKRNDYRSRRDPAQADVLNGFRGIVLEADARRGAHVQWRHGGRTEQAWISPEQIGRGDLEHGYALTVASTQGVTVDHAHVYGVGADAHTLYPAMSRARERVDLYLPAAEVEPEHVRAQLGQARTEEEGLHRVISAYAATLTDGPEPMVLDELAGGPERRQERDQQVAERAQEAASRAPTPWEPLTEEAARQGQGPAYRMAAPRLEALTEQHQQIEQALPGLRERLVEAEQHAQRRPVALWMEGTTKGAAEQERDERRDEMQAAVQERTRIAAEAQALHRQAMDVDMGQVWQDRDRQRHEQQLRRSERPALERGVTREELREMDPESLRGMQRRHVLSASAPGARRDREHQSRIEVPPQHHARQATTRDQDLDQTIQRIKDGLSAREQQREAAQQIEREDQERREREQRERDYQREEMERHHRELMERTQREAADRQAQQRGLEL